ncbi:MAG TPA: 3-oxoacyl-[acyl-carrier-protein] synthase III C-terminal domain-containing protein [Chitinolyticbacter sp.]|nr:3-oxoacyl-[acyl-carrier-protein] synthase III C-terminal domain-containing protein [Chitinolyticbacter sp.]
MWTLSGFVDEIGDDVAEQCRVAAGLGLHWAEIRSGWGTNILDLDDAQLSKLERLLADHDLAVSSIGSPIGKIFIDDDFAPHLERMRHAADVARRLRAPYVRIFSFFIRPGDDPDRHRDEVLRRMRALADVAEQTLAAAGLAKSDIDWLVPHQANLRIIEATAKHLHLPMEQVIVTVDKHGNTSAASIPLALDEGVKSGRIRPGQNLLLEGIGGGFAWGSVLLKY